MGAGLLGVQGYLGYWGGYVVADLSVASDWDQAAGISGYEAHAGPFTIASVLLVTPGNPWNRSCLSPHSLGNHFSLLQTPTSSALSVGKSRLLVTALCGPALKGLTGRSGGTHVSPESPLGLVPEGGQH